MIVIGKSENAGYFKVNGLDYPKNQYSLKYDTTDSTEEVRNFSLVSIVDKEKIISSRGYAEVQGVSSWKELLRLLSDVGAIYSNEVAIQDQHTEIIDLHLSQLIQEITLNQNYAVGIQTVSITALAAPVAGRLLCLKEDKAFFQSEIITVTNTGGNTYDLKLGMSLDYPYTVAGGCSERNTNIAVNGSVTPVIFSVSPKNLTEGIEWDIVRIIGNMISTTPMDDAKFGGILALTNGVYLRKVDTINKNVFNVKTNGDLRTHMYDVEYSDKAPAGFYGLSFRRTFGGQSRNGVVIRLAADNNDELQMVVQDDLTALTKFEVVVQGHVVEQ